jgi:hypothetical protein
MGTNMSQNPWTDMDSDFEEPECLHLIDAREGEQKKFAQDFWRYATKRGDYGFMSKNLLLGFNALL